MDAFVGGSLQERKSILLAGSFVDYHVGRQPWSLGMTVTSFYHKSYRIDETILGYLPFSRSL